MPFDFTCIHCGGTMDTNNTSVGKIVCSDCGRAIDGSIPAKREPTPSTNGDDAPTESWVMGNTYYAGEKTPWIRTLLGSLRSSLYQGDRTEILRCCQRLLEIDRDFPDALYWQAVVTDDETLKRKSLEQLLAIVPAHAEARNLLMVLNGEITQEELDRASDLYRDNRQTADGAVGADVEVLLCPICQGTLTVNSGGGVECAFCGYADVSDQHAVHAAGPTSLAVALLKQRGQAVQWTVKQRVVACNGCGAERTLPGDKMASLCPFCGSTNVIVQDALGAFRQPDGLLKFRVRRKQAEEYLEAALGSVKERLKGIFINNAVARTRFEGMFLPMWVFDIFGTVIAREEEHDDNGRVVAVNQVNYPIMRSNAAIPGVESPPQRLLKKISNYDYREITPYSPKLLAKFSAELYTVDFADASLSARSRFRDAMIKRYPSTQRTRRTITTQVDHMDMKLLLHPVWIVTIREKDDDIRLALINGQTGTVALGKARQPERG
jgi:uncharacterized protein YbaR (Trm112 family)